MNASVNLFSEPWMQRMGWVLIHFIWQGAGIALLLAIALRLLDRASSQIRYSVIAFSLIVCAALPVFTWAALGSATKPTVAQMASASQVVSQQIGTSSSRADSFSHETIREAPPKAKTSWQLDLQPAMVEISPYVVGLWLVGVLILTSRLILGWIWTQRLCRTGSPIQNLECLERFRGLINRMQVAVPVRLLQSVQIEVPALIGWLRPTILIPMSVLSGLSSDQLEAILIHELAHVRRYDYLVNLLQTVIETILFYHPAIWWISRKLREERENCCDDIVLEVMQNPLVYASALALIEDARPASLALAASGGPLLQRINRIAGLRGPKSSLLPIVITSLIIGFVAVPLIGQMATATTTAINSDAKIDFEISGRPIPISKTGEATLLRLLHELLVMRYVNGSPDTVFRWENIPGSSVEQIKASGSFLHIVYLKKPSIPVGTTYSYQTDEVWIGLQDNPAGDSYPGQCGGFMIVTSGKDGTFNLNGGSKSLLTGIGLIPDILPHLSPVMQKSLEANRVAYQDYLDWTSAKDASGQSVNQQVITAVQAGDVVTLKKLIAQGIDITKVKGRNPTLLFDAASPEVAALLIQKGVDVNARVPRGFTALDSVCRTGNAKSAAIARVLLEHGADPNSTDPVMGETPAMEAYRGDTLDALAEHGANLKAIDHDGYGLMFHAGRADVTYLQSLIRHGIVFDPKKDGPTVLVQATWVNNGAVIKWLLDHGVDPSAQGLWYRPKNGKDDMMFPLVAASISGQPDAAKLLLDHGARCPQAMSLALQNHYPAIVKLFWEHGARDISELTYDLSQNAPLAVVDKVLQSGAPVDPPEDKVITPLGEAAEMDNFPAVQLLVQHAADVNRGGSPVAEHPEYHDTPLVLASKRGQDEIVAFLLQHGAAPTVDAVSGAANGGIPSSFYSGKDHLPSKEHYERVIQLLIDAGALKTINPDWTGRLLAQAMGPCWGDPDAVVLQKLLAAGLNPEVPMPYLAERGEKPNSVIGHYLDFYAKHKEDPGYRDVTSKLKPLLDMLQAASTGKLSTTDVSIGK